ncbi:MAG: hydrogenase maturation protease [Rhodopseudomonas sp.]|uniref:hydrogenase maturation protease n=1 Tax=Rhodopseudomonas sp. TaxID=1078 RepID=UPI00180865B4|nr:hydrogenase maturation protease [Rhodopseudomonas sp.]NVN87215.1 hydrogenase maturation protease [Rhodopseudomonas sp.]
MSGAADRNAMLPKVLVVAVGNPDRADDGVGALAATGLAGRLPPDVSLVARRGDILSLIEEWAGFDAVIFIDAAASMGMPGRIHRIDAGAGELPNEVSFASSHAFGLAEAIALAAALRSLPDTVIVYAIEGASFDGGAAMTPEVTAAAAEVADRVVAEVGRLRCREGKVMSDA